MLKTYLNKLLQIYAITLQAEAQVQSEGVLAHPDSDERDIYLEGPPIYLATFQ